MSAALTKQQINYTRISWNRCISRCHNKNDPDYDRYGAKGIKVCDHWRFSFDNFLEDMGPRPEGLTLDRIDSKGNYELYDPVTGKLQCRWATSAEQNRHAQTLLEYKGKTQALGVWAEEIGIKQTTLSMRLKKGMSVEEAFETPVAK